MERKSYGLEKKTAINNEHSRLALRHDLHGEAQHYTPRLWPFGKLRTNGDTQCEQRGYPISVPDTRTRMNLKVGVYVCLFLSGAKAPAPHVHAIQPGSEAYSLVRYR